MNAWPRFCVTPVFLLLLLQACMPVAQSLRSSLVCSTIHCTETALGQVTQDSSSQLSQHLSLVTVQLTVRGVWPCVWGVAAWNVGCAHQGKHGRNREDSKWDCPVSVCNVQPDGSVPHQRDLCRQHRTQLHRLMSRWPLAPHSTCTCTQLHRLTMTI